jgi:predicted ester cyclase
VVLAICKDALRREHTSSAAGPGQPERHAACIRARAAPASKENGKMATDNIALVRRIVEDVWNKGNVGVLGEIVSDRYVGYHPLIGMVRGLEGFRQHVQSFRTAFPDLNLTVDDVGMVGERVFVRWTARATHRGAFMGLTPSNNKGQISGISINRFADGKLIELHESYDTLSLFQLMGVVPPLDRMVKGEKGQPQQQIPRA